MDEVSRNRRVRASPAHNVDAGYNRRSAFAPEATGRVNTRSTRGLENARTRPSRIGSTTRLRQHLQALPMAPASTLNPLVEPTIRAPVGPGTHEPARLLAMLTRVGLVAPHLEAAAAPPPGEVGEVLDASRSPEDE